MIIINTPTKIPAKLLPLPSSVCGSLGPKDMISPVSDELAKCSVLSNTLQHSHTARDAECSLFKDEGWKKLLYRK